MKKKKISIIGIICAAFILLVILFGVSFYTENYYTSRTDEAKQALASLAEGGYDGLFLTMYGNEMFDATDFMNYRAQNMCYPSKDFRNLRALGDFLEQAFRVDPELSNVYLTLDPYKTDGDFLYVAALYQREYMRNLTSYMERYPETKFEILLPCYSMEKLLKLSAGGLDDYFVSIQDFLNILAPYPNAKTFFMGDELFFSSNPGLYEKNGSMNATYQKVQLLFAFRDDQYVLNVENAKERFAKHREQIEARRNAERKDLSGKTIVFFGDSVMANDRNSFTVPGVMAGLSNADCVNMAMGGSTACDSIELINTEYNLGWVADAFLTKDAQRFPKFQRLEKTLREYLSSNQEPDCFVIAFGVNDYFNGLPVEGTDTFSYMGALKSAVSKLKNAYPNAQILIMSPTLCACNEFGEEVIGGNVLLDYVEAAQIVAKEEAVEFLDNYHFVSMTEENYFDYIPDKVHPGDLYKFMLAERILDKLETIILK